MAHNQFYAAVYYKAPLAALEWLSKAFGFEVAMLVQDDDGALQYSEMSHNGAILSVEPAAADWRRSPQTQDGANTVSLCAVVEDVDAHAASARAAGARIRQAPETQPYGARTYRAIDPEGRVWMFSQQPSAPQGEARQP